MLKMNFECDFRHKNGWGLELWIDLHQNRVEKVDLGVKNERKEPIFRERTRTGLPNKERRGTVAI